MADNDHGEGRVDWDPTEIDLSADEAVGDRQEPGRPDEARSTATEFLKLELANGRKMRAPLVQLAWSKGITLPTLERAARKVNLTKSPGTENKREMLWSLPEPAGSGPTETPSAAGAD